jgi:hypothetical protein
MGGVFILAEDEGFVYISAMRGRNKCGHQFLNWWQQYATGILRFGLFESLSDDKK